MKDLARLLAALAAVVTVLLIFVGYRTWTFEAPVAIDHSSVALRDAPAVDLDLAARHLSEAVQIRTISNQNPKDNDLVQWDRLHAWLRQTYPTLHAAATSELVAGKTLIYTWAGSDASLEPIILMAHQDVVPVAPGTEKNWTRPPFDGVIADGAVWGRGSIDDKGSLIGIFEAAEALAVVGFKPRRTVMIVAGHDEELLGSGAIAAADLLKQRGVTASFALDEGLVTVADFPILNGPAALIGIAEKGYATLRVMARTDGGHSSMPPPESSVAILARALLAITNDQDPLRFQGPGADMIRTLAPHASLLTRVAVANEWLLGSLLVHEVASTPAGAALLHTTTAPTMLRGSPKENVLAQDASAVINYRILPGQTADDVMARASKAVRKIPVQLDWVGKPHDPSGISSTDSEGWKIIAALASDGGRTPVAPGLVLAATDSRHFAGVARDIYRYQPLVLSLKDLDSIHGTNERMSLDNLRRMVEFYGRLIATAAG